jgi:hypothetical protein
MYTKNDRQNNRVEVRGNGNVYFYSYQTLVAIAFPAIRLVAYTEKKWSLTTTRHINGFISSYRQEGFTKLGVDQDTLEMEFVHRA